MDNTGIIILAAGNSSRLGRPKQLLPYQGTTLLAHVVTEALAANLHPVVVVTGAFANEITTALPVEKIQIAHNPRWQDGMAGSIVIGLNAIQNAQPAPAAVIIAVCDQPHLTTQLLQTLLHTRATTQKGIVACIYSEAIGTPALFTRHYFDALSTLSGNEGAKKLLRQYPDDLALVPFPKGAIDIDTAEDYESLTSQGN
ncbi:nucleotidyltransferase family protein [Puia sp.]|jgi:molybdenum cofactor cytidylyltransferase|uniref:nucleotidyltransferase family protein n=1 Tax=Puia sp. TaxID=2045100 RepID=UPI002F415C7D